jgi:hypothetical protein
MLDVAATVPELIVDISTQLEIYDRVPAGHLVHAIENNRMAPLFEAGDVAVIATDGPADCLPIDGGLFLIEHAAPPATPSERVARRTRELVQTNLRQLPSGEEHWFAEPLNPLTFSGGVPSLLEIAAAFGPYRDADDLARLLIGRVVGIYNPAWKGL